MKTTNKKFVIGLDYGSDSVRALLVDAVDGTEISSSVFYYPRWKKELFCDASKNQFRQHPLDYIEGLEFTIKDCLKNVDKSIRDNVVAISVDTTGSTPCAVDRSGTPLALYDTFAENPDAMFVLWKDHTAIQEAAEINDLCSGWEIDYRKYEGGIYSSEWFWAKVLRVLREDSTVRDNAYSFVEHCDWIPFLLTGGDDVDHMKRGRCSAGHKALWHREWDGLPSENFLITLDPLLGGLRDRLFQDTYTADTAVGYLSEEWANRLGLSTSVKIGAGAFDAHMGAVGGEIEPYHLSKVMGTSTCDMLVAPTEEMNGKLVHGICGQVDGSIIPGMEGLEAGQSAFGDILAWFKKVVAWPTVSLLNDSSLLDEQTKRRLEQEILDGIIPNLSKEAALIPIAESKIVALDWMNGRRTPDANQLLKGALFNLNLGTDAPKIFKALVESMCFGAKKIVDRFLDQGVPVKGIIGLGGVAKKSPYVMQVMADVLNMPIKIAKSEQTCALGAGMFAATVAGIYDTVEQAATAMGAGFDAEYQPIPENVKQYALLYAKYEKYGDFIEKDSGLVQNESSQEVEIMG